jgi:hypothetical protein
MRQKVSKRIIGAITYALGLSMAAISGLHWYEVDSAIILAVLANGTALLGIDAWKAVKENGKKRNYAKRH